jgi:hypothetical protein
MGAVIKFPRGIPLRGRPARPPDAAPAVIIILPVVRIERAAQAPSSVKARAKSSTTTRSTTAKSTARPVTKRAAKAAAKPVIAKSVIAKSVIAKSVIAKSVIARPVIKAAAKPSPARKRRKRVTAELPSPACSSSG